MEVIVGFECENEVVCCEMVVMECCCEEIVCEFTDREVGVLKREESVTEREYELCVVEGCLGVLKECVLDEEVWLRCVIECVDVVEK